MRNSKLFLVSVLVLISCSCSSLEERSDVVPGIVWQVDNLGPNAAHEAKVLGSPAVVETVAGRAWQFDGVKDGLVVNSLPLAGAEKFTLEIIFRPDSEGLKEQRFLHLQETGTESRILIETRLTENNQWYLDTYIHTEKAGLALYEPTNTHPVGRWYNATLVYDGRRMSHYVNGRQELSKKLAFRPLVQGKTSIGVRMNKVFWFKGAIRKVRFTRGVLKSEQFLKP